MSRTRPAKLCQTGRRGAAAVEFAVCSPVIFMLVGGLFDWGTALHDQLSVITVVRDAARYAASADDPAAAALSRLHASALAVGLPAPSSNTTAVVEDDPDLGAQILTLHLAVPYQPVLGIVPTPSELTADVVMQLEIL